MSFPGRREAPNILHSGKMLALYFEDEIAGLHKWPFLAGVLTFSVQFFLYLHHPFEGSPLPTQLIVPSQKRQLNREINYTHTPHIFGTN